MGITLGTSGGNETLQAVTVGTSDGNKPVIAGWVGTTDGNKQIFAALAAVNDPSLLPVTFGQGTTTSDTVTAVPSGGIGPFTYSWARVSGDDVIVPTSSTNATTAFRTFLQEDDAFSASFVCTVTDTATGAVADTPALGVGFFWAGV